MKHDLDRAIVCVVGLGYVGLPLAEAFANVVQVIGFDTDSEKVNHLMTRQLATATHSAGITFTTDPGDLGKADFIAICVPTPVTRSKDPDLSY
ncbi:MAG: nucleotide sugar dehydrogenase, partial [Planctomycetes bacterium]|nr:nucleotide sugar dehydrogenase [Planctomycetota bacterium]